MTDQKPRPVAASEQAIASQKPRPAPAPGQAAASQQQRPAGRPAQAAAGPQARPAIGSSPPGAAVPEQSLAGQKPRPGAAAPDHKPAAAKGTVVPLNMASGRPGPVQAGAADAHPAGANAPTATRDGASSNLPAPAGRASPSAPPNKKMPVGEVRPAKAPLVLDLDQEVLLLEYKGLLRAKRKAFLLKVLLFIAAPTLAVMCYAYFYATPRYVSEFQVVYNNTGSSSAASGLAALMGTGDTTDMTRVVSAYIASTAMLSIVDKKLNLRSEYSDAKIDWIDRMPANASDETFLKYFQRRVSVYENTGGYLTVDVESFSPQRALETARVINEAADAMVDDLNDRPRRDFVTFTHKELERFEQSLNIATMMLTRFREEHSEYNYSNVVSQLSSVVGTLQSQLAETRTQLARDKQFLSADAPSVRDLEAKIASLESQIQIERTRYGTPQNVENEVSAKNPVDPHATHDNASYSQIMAQYADLTLAQELAKTDYAAAKQSYEAAVLALAKKTAYVVNFVPPQLPQTATRPDGKYLASTTLIATMLLYFLSTLILGLLRDQIAHH